MAHIELHDELEDLHGRIHDMKERYPTGFPFERNGLRLAIAAIEDESKELYDEWCKHKRLLANGVLEIRHELLDIAGVAMLAYERTFDGFLKDSDYAER